MYCLKCGRDTVANKIFCEDCLSDMDRYPVKPGTAVQLPQRAPKSAPKKPTKRPATPEEQIHSLKRARFWLTVIVVLLSITFCLALLFPRPVNKPPAATTTEVTTEATTEANTESTTEATAEATTEAPPQTATENTTA